MPSATRQRPRAVRRKESQPTMTSVTETKNVIYGLYCVCDRCDIPTIRYIGQTQETAPSRLSKHRWNARNNKPQAVCGWMRKHGPENIRTVVLESVFSANDLDNAELWWINLLGTLYTEGSGGVNVWPGGNSMRGYKWPEGAVRGMLGRRHTEETKKRLREASSRHVGDTSSNHKLSSEEVLEIRRRFALGGVSFSRLGKEYSVTPETISSVVKRKTWKHI